MNAFLDILLRISLSGALVSLLILLLKPILKKRVSKSFMYYIWVIVLLRLVVPIGIGVELPKIADMPDDTQEYSGEILSGISNISESISEESFFESFVFSENAESVDEVSKNENTENEYSTIISVDKHESDKNKNEQSFDEFLPIVGIESTENQSEYVDCNSESIVNNEQDVQDSVVERENEIFAFLNDNLFAIWIVGFSATLIWYSVSYIVFNMSLKKSFYAPNPEDWKIFNEVCGKSKVRLVMSDKSKIPMLMGVFNPKIVLPKAEYCINGKSEELRCILMHELVHFKRKDIVLKWVTIFISSLHWFNPAVYFVKNNIDEFCELSCDEEVIKTLNDAQRKLYGNTLIALSSKEERKRFGMAATLFEDKKQLKERLVNIMKYRKMSRSAVCLMLVFALLLVGCALTVPTFDESSDIPSDYESSTESEYESDNSKNENSDSENSETEEERTAKQQNFDALKSVLLSEKEFYPIVVNLDGTVSFSIDELSDFWGHIDMTYPIMFTAVDLDKDGKNEIVLRLSRDNKNYQNLVLHYDEKVYGYQFEDDEMCDLKSDGTFAWNTKNESGYAFIGSFEKSTADEYPNGYKRNSFAYVWLEESSDERVMHYEVNGKLSDFEEFSDVSVAHNEKNGATWYEFNEVNINNVLSITSEPIDLEPLWKTDESERAMRAYKRVMNGEISFVCPKVSEDAENEEYKIDELGKYVTEDSEPVGLICFAVIDLDADKVPEIVNWLGAGVDNANSCVGFQILHYKEGRVYSYLLYAREFIALKYDGTYSWNASSEFYGISKIEKFLTVRGRDNRDYTNIAIAGSAISGTPQELIHYHLDKHITYDEYEHLVIEQIEKPSPIWYSFSTDNVEKMISVDILLEKPNDENQDIPTINETIDIINQPDGSIKTVERTFYENSDVVKREMVTIEKEGVKLSCEISNYYEDGNLSSHTLETFKGEDVYEDTEFYENEGYNAGEVEHFSLVNGQRIKSKRYFDGELIEEMFYEGDVCITNYYLDGKMYYYEKSFPTTVFITETEDRPRNIWDGTTTERYNADGVLLVRDVGVVTEHPIDDERIVQTHVIEPGHDYWDRWILLGSGNDTEFVAQIVTDLTGKGIIRFENIADGRTMDEVWQLWNDYNTYYDKLNEFYNYRTNKIYGLNN